MRTAKLAASPHFSRSLLNKTVVSNLTECYCKFTCVYIKWEEVAWSNDKIGRSVRQLYGFSLRPETRCLILEIGVIIFIILSCLKSCIVLARETGSPVL